MKVFTRKPVVWTSWTIVILILFTGEWILSLFLWGFPIQSNKKTFSSRRLAENLNRGSHGQSSFLRKWIVRNPEFPVPRSGRSIFYHVFTSDFYYNRFLKFYIKASSSPYRPSSFLQESALSRAQRRLVFFSVPLLPASPITTLPLLLICRCIFTFVGMVCTNYPEIYCFHVLLFSSKHIVWTHTRGLWTWTQRVLRVMDSSHRTVCHSVMDRGRVFP